MTFDSHCHIQFPVYDADRAAVIARAQAVGLPRQSEATAGVKMIAVGTQAESSAAAIKLAEQYPRDIWATVGFHPNHALSAIAASFAEVATKAESAKAGATAWHHDKNEQAQAEPEIFDVQKFRILAAHPRVVAIGECGLDYFRLDVDNVDEKQSQKEVFARQIELASELRKPLMLHIRPANGAGDAYVDAFDMLRAAKFSGVVVWHFFAGSLEMTKKILASGGYFTFGGVVTFARDYDEIIRAIPLDRILVETDAPYVAPEPYRGQRNEPAWVVEVAKKIAELKSADYAEVAATTTQNVCQVFGIRI